jgi:hypothetical protein
LKLCLFALHQSLINLSCGEEETQFSLVQNVGKTMHICLKVHSGVMSLFPLGSFLLNKVKLTHIMPIIFSKHSCHRKI